MASVLVDPDDIEYMDEIDEDEGVACDKTRKKRKNRIIHEALQVNSNEPMVRELRQDRQRLLNEQENEKANQKSSSMRMLKELQQDRKLALQGQKQYRGKGETEKLIPSEEISEEPTYASIKEIKARRELAETALVHEHADKAETISGIYIEDPNLSSSTDSVFLREADQDIAGAEREQAQEDSENQKAAMHKTQLSASHLPVKQGSNEKRTTMYQNQSHEDVVRPKNNSDARILMLDEPSTSSAKPGTCKTTDDIKQHRKSKTKSKAPKEMAGIQIIITEPQEEEENGSSKKLNGNVQGKAPGMSRSKSETSADISEEGSSGFSGLVSLNFLRRMSNENKSEGSGNDLLAKRAIYEQSKTKPFKKLVKIKSGLFEVGIEGDSKTSYIKAMTIMPDKKLIMFDRANQCLKLYDNDFNPLDRVSVHVKFCGLTPVFDATVAATFPEMKQLQLYHINKTNSSLQRGRTQTTLGEYYAIAHYDNKLFVLRRQKKLDTFSDDKWSIEKIDLNIGDAEPIVLRHLHPGHKDNNLYANSEGLYMTNKLEGEILLLDHDGHFKLRGRPEMSLPMCITSDGQGNMFVCGGSINSQIEVFKPDLKGSKVIFNKKAQDLVSMCYDKQGNYLYVSDKITGRVLRYKIEHSGFVQGLMRSIVTGSGISC